MKRYLKKLKPLNAWIDRQLEKYAWPLFIAMTTIFILAFMSGIDKHMGGY